MGKTFQWRWSSCWKSTFHLFSEWHCTWLILDPLDSWTLWTLGILWWNLCPKNDHYKTLLPSVQCSSVQLLSRVWLFATPWTAAHQASPSITNSWSLLKLMSIELVMPSSHLILCGPLLLLPPIPLSIRVFPMSQLFAWGGQSTGVSALASFLPKKSQGWSPLDFLISVTFNL